MKKTMLVGPLLILALTACGATEFSGGGDGLDEKSLGSTSGMGGADGLLSQTARSCDGDHDANEGCDCLDDSDMRIPQPTIEEFLAMVADDAPAAQQVLEDNRCYISHGGGHGVELCLLGDKSALRGLSPIEIKGDEICVPSETLIEGADLFTGAKLGECNY